MQYCVDHPEEISKFAKVKAQVSEVKGVMMENIEKVKLHSFLLLHVEILLFMLSFGLLHMDGALLTVWDLARSRFLIVVRKLSSLLTKQRTFALRFVIFVFLL